MAEVTFDDLRETGFGTRIVIHDGDEQVKGIFTGIMPGKPGGKGRQKYDAAIVKTGERTFRYVRRNHAGCIKIDKRTGRRRGR